MVLEGLNWVQNDKITLNGLERNQLGSQCKMKSNGLEMSQLGSQCKYQVIWS